MDVLPQAYYLYTYYLYTCVYVYECKYLFMHIYVHVWAKTSYLLARQGLGGLTAETHSTDLQRVISSVT